MVSTTYFPVRTAEKAELMSANLEVHLINYVCDIGLCISATTCY